MNLPRSFVQVVRLFCVLGLASVALAANPAQPEALGFSAERLGRLDAVIQDEVDRHRIAGAVMFIARDGQPAHFKAYGLQDIEAEKPMATDAIFRIASMSKAVTSIAAMILVEEGRLTLGDPVSKFIPAFKKTTVMVPPPAGALPGTAVSVVPAKREITIKDLLTHTSGVSYGDGPAAALYDAARVHGWYFADKPEPIASAIDRLAALPFEAQPGDKYVYGFSTDILGVVVEKASGQSLDAFFQGRIFGPLGMSDSSFYLPVEKRSRLAAVYKPGADGKIERAPDAGMDGQGAYVEGPRQCFAGGAGLLSTARDYSRLLQMMLNGGALDGVRVLGPKTVELMTSNHVGNLQDEGRTGFGLGFEITEHVGRSGRYGSVGEFGWGGAYYTSYWADPEEKLVALFMAQLRPWGDIDLHPKFRALVYQAIEGPAR
jgi:CubicO group peptidase (beta-lactamase class C family)